MVHGLVLQHDVNLSRARKACTPAGRPERKWPREKELQREYSTFKSSFKVYNMHTKTHAELDSSTVLKQIFCEYHPLKSKH